MVHISFFISSTSLQFIELPFEMTDAIADCSPPALGVLLLGDETKAGFLFLESENTLAILR